MMNMSSGGWVLQALCFALGLVFAVPAISNEIVGLPLCPPTEGNDTLLFPNPDNCTTFFQCSHGEAIEKSCPDGLMYNAELRSCDWPINVDCQQKDQPTIVAYPVSCDKAPIRGDPYDCTAFLYCIEDDDNYAVVVRCPGGLFFNDKILVCDYPENVECNAVGTYKYKIISNL